MPLYAWGSNGSGQLGMGHTLDLDHPNLSTEVLDVTASLPKAIAAGGNHTLVLDTLGRLYAAGVVSGQSPPAVFIDLKFCSATWDASILCTHSNKIIVFGNGVLGELGLGPGVASTSTAQALDLEAVNPERASVVQLASSIQHTVAVLSNGDAIGWGNGRKGQLGEPAHVIWTPRKIPGIDFKVLRAACGQGFTILVGEPKLGQLVVLGHDKWAIKAAAPKFVPGWKSIHAGWNTGAVLFNDGSVMSWGRSDHGQLSSPIGVEFVQLALGSEHSLGLASDGTLWAWGWGEHGNCGPNTDEAGDARLAQEVALPPGVDKVRGVGAGCATSWIWT